GADRVNVGPGAHRRVAAVHFWRGKTGRVHGPDEVAFLAQHLASRAKVNHHGPVVVGDENIGGLDVQVQHFVLMHDAQSAQDFVTQRTNGRFAENILFFQLAGRDDEVLQGAALQVVHDHVNGLVLAEKI